MLDMVSCRSILDPTGWGISLCLFLLYIGARLNAIGYVSYD